MECWSDARCRILQLQPCRDRVAFDVNDANGAKGAKGASMEEYHYIEERSETVEGGLEDCRLEKRWGCGGLDQVFGVEDDENASML